VIAQRMPPDALFGEMVELSVEFGRDIQLLVVVVKDGFGLIALLLAVAGAGGQVVHIDLLVWHMPLNIRHRDEVSYPGFQPSIETDSNKILGIVSVAGGQRCEQGDL